MPACQLGCSGTRILAVDLAELRPFVRNLLSNASPSPEHAFIQVGTETLPLCEQDIRMVDPQAPLDSLSVALANSVERVTAKPRLYWPNRVVRQVLQWCGTALDCCKELLAHVERNGFAEGSVERDRETRVALDRFTCVLDEVAAEGYRATPLPLLAVLAEAGLCGALAMLLHGRDVAEVTRRGGMFYPAMQVLRRVSALPDLALLLGQPYMLHGVSASVLGCLSALAESARVFLELAGTASSSYNDNPKEREQQRKMAKRVIETHLVLRAEVEAAREQLTLQQASYRAPHPREVNELDRLVQQAAQLHLPSSTPQHQHHHQYQSAVQPSGYALGQGQYSSAKPYGYGGTNGGGLSLLHGGGTAALGGSVGARSGSDYRVVSTEELYPVGTSGRPAAGAAGAAMEALRVQRELQRLQPNGGGTGTGLFDATAAETGSSGAGSFASATGYSSYSSSFGRSTQATATWGRDASLATASPRDYSPEQRRQEAGIQSTSLSQQQMLLQQQQASAGSWSVADFMHDNSRDAAAPSAPPATGQYLTSTYGAASQHSLHGGQQVTTGSASYSQASAPPAPRSRLSSTQAADATTTSFGLLHGGGMPTHGHLGAARGGSGGNGQQYDTGSHLGGYGLRGGGGGSSYGHNNAAGASSGPSGRTASSGGGGVANTLDRYLGQQPHAASPQFGLEQHPRPAGASSQAGRPGSASRSRPAQTGAGAGPAATTYGGSAHRRQDSGAASDDCGPEDDTYTINDYGMVQRAGPSGSGVTRARMPSAPPVRQPLLPPSLALPSLSAQYLGQDPTSAKGGPPPPSPRYTQDPSSGTPRASRAAASSAALALASNTAAAQRLVSRDLGRYSCDSSSSSALDSASGLLLGDVSYVDEPRILVGARLPLAELIDRYSSSSPLLSAKLLSLEGEFGDTRRIAGDGNCFYRAALFALLEQALVAPDPRLGDRLSLTFQRHTSQLQRQGQGQDAAGGDAASAAAAAAARPEALRGGQLLIRFLALAWYMGPDTDTPSDLPALERLFSNAADSDAAVLFVRSLTSQELLSRSDFYGPFVNGCCGEYSGLSVAQLVARHVLPMGQEVEQPQIIAFASALGAVVGVLDVAGSQVQAIKHGPADGLDEPPAGWVVHLPGHYDVIYPCKRLDVGAAGQVVPAAAGAR